ncbi:Ubiquitin-like domain-containing protein [Forsythia ovata]|uniref:Ubiquitin-like domain-containing protein n=1 Tax=Forsythia ovata TaxID=205694 RepID=A0ABD1U7N0_9LAMI
MVRESVPAVSQPLAGTVSAENAYNSCVTQGASPNVEGSGGTGLRASMFPGLGLGTLGGTKASGLFGARLPEFEQMQQQLTQNPNERNNERNSHSKQKEQP